MVANKDFEIFNFLKWQNMEFLPLVSQGQKYPFRDSIFT